MRFFTKDYLAILKKVVQLSTIKSKLPILLILLGAVAIATALEADYIGIGKGGSIGYRQTILGLVGFVILASGIALDQASGRRYTDNWLAQVIPDKQSIGKFLSIAIQLGLLVLIIRQYQLENHAFYFYIMRLTFYGFLIFHFLPYKFRLPFFLLLSFIGFFEVLGLSNGIWLIGIGLVLIGICHLPISYSTRVAILLITVAFLAVLRVGWLNALWPSAVWPILGSMFMFRLIIYLYDLRHAKNPGNISSTLSYFFLLPNVVFPLFPVVDYKTFCRTYYDDNQYLIYQRGLKLMFRGITHLILYRYVNYYLLISPEEVADISTLLRYLISNFLMYLRISGQFHLAIGILHLFGFDLPETNHLYYLASSFTDYWRRVNIYWKDFMMKVFYYPAYFRLRKLGNITALVLSTLFVFFVTWFLHSYQWFWLRGSFSVILTDIVFWTIFALLILANVLYEKKYDRERTLRKRSRTLYGIISLAIRTAGTFTVICILWSLWTSASLSEWSSLWSSAGVSLAGSFKVTFILFSLITLLFVLGMVIGKLFWQWSMGKKSLSGIRKQPVFLRSMVANAAFIILLFAISSEGIYSKFGLKAREVIRDLQFAGLSQRDTELLRRGYYEDLTGVNRFNSQLWEIYMNRRENCKSLIQLGICKETDNFYGWELLPSSRVMFYGKSYSTNHWGMRDQDYKLIPPPGSYRIAVVGSSLTNGWGVADNELFESLLEARLNKENYRGRYSRYEFLNFAVGGYSSIQILMVVEKKIFPFQPNVLFFVTHTAEIERSFLRLWKIVQDGIPYDNYLSEIVQQAEIVNGMPSTLAEKNLKPYGERLTSWIYNRIVVHCRQHGSLPVWILLPSEPSDNNYAEETAILLRLAEEAGFITLNLVDVFENQDVKSLQVASWDLHPNAKAHKLIADRLYNELSENKEIIDR